MLYKLIEDVIKFDDYYSSMISELLYKSIEEERLKILTPKKCFKDHQ